MKFTKVYIQITDLFSFLSMSNVQTHAKVGGTKLFRNVAKKHRPETSNNPPLPPSPSPARGNTIRTGGGGSIFLLPLPPSPSKFRTHTPPPPPTNRPRTRTPLSVRVVLGESLQPLRRVALGPLEREPQRPVPIELAQPAHGPRHPE